MYQQNQIAPDEQEALEYVRDIKGFYSHAIWYAVVNTILLVWNLIVSPDQLWFIWSLLGWGLGLAAHGFSVFEVFSLFGTDWERNQVEKRLRRQRGRK